MFPIKMKMNCSSGSPFVVLLLSLNLCHTDRSLSTKGWSGPTASQHITSLPESSVYCTHRGTKLCREAVEEEEVEVLDGLNSS